MSKLRRIMWNKTSNKCFQREIAREHALHRLKLSKSRARVDTSQPRTASHLKSRAKSVMQKKERSTMIERDNALLLRRMIDIEAKPSPVGPYSQTNFYPPEASLNRATRINQLTRILNENRAILQRLQRTKSNYSVQSLLKESATQDYLAYQVSTNSGRIPKVLTFNEQAYDTFNLLRPSSNPRRRTSVDSRGLYTHDNRPMTAGRLGQ
jgi:hypothetical protein